MIGTEYFCGLNSHLGLTQSPRDDIESLGYLLIYFLKGTLPWAEITDLKDKTDSVREKEVLECKKGKQVNKLCSDCPTEFAKLISYAKSLKFNEKPNYQSLRESFANCAVWNYLTFDFMYDWIENKVRMDELDDNDGLCGRIKKFWS